MNNNRPHFDAHCHLFNLKYLFYELAEMTQNMCKGDYPANLTNMPKDYPKSQPESIQDFKRWIEQFAKASVESEAKNFEHMQTWGKEFWKDKRPIAAIPLMMDIYYMFSPSIGPNQSAQIPQRTRGTFWNRILQKLGWTEPYFDTLGFRHHRKQLQALVKSKPSEVFPFFAVDPRRPGVINAILKGGIVSKQGPFFGIKLYPRLGYHPQCTDLWPLYAWCAKQGIPIVTHADIIGFPTPVLEGKIKTNYGPIGAPNNFIPILEKHPNLILDFAHFGMSEPTWADQIASLMGKYANVYSDLSCYTDADKLNQFYTKHWHKPGVATKTMFGSDFDVFLAVSFGTSMQEYFAQFRKTFKPEELEVMATDAPLRFLGRA